MLNALIVDDEVLARQRLRALLKPTIEEGRLTVAAEAADGVKALDVLGEEAIDVLFLDIQMPELSGFDVLENLAPEQRPEVIFTTAYDTYALRAFEQNAVDYLLKPISKDRLAEAVARAERRHAAPDLRRASIERLEEMLRWIETQGDDRKEKPSYPKQISVEHHDRIRVVPVARIVCVEINEGITRLYELDADEAGGRANLRQHVVDYTLEHLEASLDPDAFMRVHRSALVQLRHVEELIPWFSGRYKLVLAQGHEVIASRERSKTLRERLSL